ncbi:MAG: glycosyltransferase family 2 protein [Bacteroidetes bacterium]|nr:glycosyltransferase family 2 protein [Bacteroidota bacterium]
MKTQYEQLKPTIAVVIPFYNGAKFWSELVRSLIDQTSKLDEAVIVLDGKEQFLPDDNLDEIAYEVKVIKLNQNRGVANARNIGLDAVTSDYIFFLDQDDYFYPNRVEAVRHFIYEKDPLWIVNSYNMVSEDGSLIKKIIPSKWLESSNKQARLENQFMYQNGFARISTLCCKRTIVGRFDPKMGSSDDFVFVFGLLDTSAPCILNEVGNARRYHGSNSSQNISHRRSQIKANAYLYRKYMFDYKVRKRSLSRLCCNLAIESMVYRSKSYAIRNFLRSFKLDFFNIKALVGLILCKIFKDPVTVLNKIKLVLNVIKISRSKKMVGS